MISSVFGCFNNAVTISKCKKYLCLFVRLNLTAPVWPCNLHCSQQSQQVFIALLLHLDPCLHQIFALFVNILLFLSKHFIHTFFFFKLTYSVAHCFSSEYAYYLIYFEFFSCRKYLANNFVNRQKSQKLLTCATLSLIWLWPQGRTVELLKFHMKKRKLLCHSKINLPSLEPRLLSLYTFIILNKIKSLQHKYFKAIILDVQQLPLHLHMLQPT